MYSPIESALGRGQIENLKSLARDVPEGCFAEVGVFHGGSAYHLYEVALLQGRELHLFDTFAGTPFFVVGLDEHKIGDEFADSGAPKRIREFMPLAKLHIGIYPDTHPADLKDVAFVHCDCDQYDSYVAVITHMWPIMPLGAVMLFDDYHLAGAKKAVHEFFLEKELKRNAGRHYVRKAAEEFSVNRDVR